MKKVIILTSLVALILINSTAFAGYKLSDETSKHINRPEMTETSNNHYAQVRVRGYYKRNGTYVQPHTRSNPDGISWNNWSACNEMGSKTDPYNPDVIKFASKLV
jgi:hypothetical protein